MFIVLPNLMDAGEFEKKTFSDGFLAFHFMISHSDFNQWHYWWGSIYVFSHIFIWIRSGRDTDLL